VLLATGSCFDSVLALQPTMREPTMRQPPMRGRTAANDDTQLARREAPDVGRSPDPVESARRVCI
jgi:hypothetical protein